MRKSLLLLSIAVLSIFNAHSQDFSNKGKDFWVGYGYHAIMLNGGNAQDMFLYFATDQPTTITVTIPGLGWSRTYTSGAGNSIITSDAMPKNIPDARLTSESTSPEGKGIHITSTQPIVAYAHVFNQNASGATLLYPTPTLGKEYYSVNYKNESNTTLANCWFYVIATEPGITQVEITPSEDAGSHPAGAPFTVNLNQGQIYNVMGNFGGAKNSDLTGSKIRSLAGAGGSCKRIAVFSGSGRIGIVCPGNTVSSDNYMVQALPKTAWGKNYLTSPTAGYGNSITPYAFNIYRICVLDPTTQVFIDGVLTPLPLQAGFYYEIPITNTKHSITADKEIMVSQYLTSAGACGNVSGDGDPEVIYLSPIEQSISSVTWNACRLFQINPNKHYINIIIPNTGTAISSFKLDGVTVAASNFTPHPQKLNYSCATLKVTSSGSGSGLSHIVTSDSGFNAIAYGYGSVESYGYNAGTNVKDLNQALEINTQYGIETTASVCTGSPFTFKVYLPDSTTAIIPQAIRYDSIKWESNNHAVMAPNNFPLMIYGTGLPAVVQPDSLNYRNGKPVAWYSLATPYAFSTPGTYDITLTVYRTSTEGCGNEQDYPFRLTVSDPPTASFSYIPGGCYAEPYLFKETTPQLPKATYHFYWDFGDPASGPTNNIDSVNRNITHIFSGPGLYKVRFSDITTPGCLSDTIEQFINVPDLPDATIAGSSTSCINTAVPPVTFTGTDGTAPYTFYYHINTGGALSNTTGIINPPNNVAGTFIYILDSVRNTGSTACVRTITGQQVTVTITPDATLSLSLTSPGTASQTKCINTPIDKIVYDFGASATGAIEDATSGSVYPPGVSGVIVGSTFEITGTPTAPGVYKYYIKTQGPCINPVLSGTITVTDDASISPAPANSTQTVCINKLILPITFAIGGSATGVVISPALPPGLTGTYSGGNYTIIGAPTVAGPYTYTVQANGPCLSATSLSATITVTPDGFATLNTAPGTTSQTVCVNSLITQIKYGWGGSATGANVVFSPSTPPGITWAIVGSELVIDGSSSVANTYTYRIDPIGPCDNPPLTGTLIVKPLPTATIARSVAEACLNASPAPTVTFTGGTGVAPYTFVYTIDAGSGPGAPITQSSTLPNNFITLNVPVTTATTYTYTLISVQEGSGNACLNTLAVPLITSVKINPLPNATIGGAITVCQNEPGPPITFTGSGGTAPYTFNYTINGVVQTPRTSDATGIITFPASTLVPGLFEYEITLVTDASLTTCSRTLTGVKATVNVKLLPAVSVTKDAAEVCLNGTQPKIFLNAVNGTAPFIFSYNIFDGVTTSPTLTINSDALGNAVLNVPTTTAGTFIYTILSVQESSTNACVHPNLNMTQTIKVNPLPTASLVLNTPEACRNATPAPKITFTGANGTAPYKFTYSINTVTQPVLTSAGNSITIDASTAVAGAFHYELISVSDNTSTLCSQPQNGFVDVTINELPTASFTVSAPTCQSKTITFTSTSVPGSGLLDTYDWDFGDASPHGTNAVEVHTYPLSQPYTVKLTVKNNKTCLSPTVSQIVTVNVNPQTGFMVPEACVDDIVTFTDTSKISFGSLASTPGSYYWDFDDIPSGVNNTSTTKDGVHQFTTPKVYHVMHVSTSTLGCKDTVYHDITINAANPTSSYIVNNPTTLCSSDTVRIINKSTVAFGDVTKLEIYWDNVGAPAAFDLDNDPLFDKEYKHKYPTLQTTKTYDVRMRAYSGTVCFTDFIQTITVNATPKVQFNPLPDACWDAAPYALTQGSEIGGVVGNGVYSGPGITGTNTFNPALAGIGSHIIKYTYTATAGGCLDTLSRTIIVRDTATANFTHSTPACDGTAMQFKDESTAPSGINLSTVTWDFGDASPLQTVAAGSTVSHVYPGAADYTVKLYSTTDYGCKSTLRTQSIKISPIPNPQFDFVETSVCLPTAVVNFKNNSTIADGSGLVYSWDYGDGTPAVTGVERPHTFTGVGPYIVTLTAKSDSLCTKTFSRTINFIHPQPKAAYTTNKPSVCILSDVEFTDVTDPLDGTTTAWNWDLGDASIRNTKTFTYTYGTVDSFYVELYITNSHGCNSDTTHQLFAVYEYPTVELGQNKQVLEGGSIKFEPIVTGQDLHYLWSPATYLTDITIKSPTARIIKQDISYKLTVTGIGGCPAQDNISVKVLKFPVIPNTITPNGDGQHDLWIIEYLETYPDNRVQVFTRTGQLVFESRGYTKPWDGTKNGKPLPIDTYYYVIEPGNGRDPITGYVTILK